MGFNVTNNKLCRTEKESPSPATDPAEEPVSTQPLAKVIIRLASTLSTPQPFRRESADDEGNGCKCEPIGDCPVELMDFSFALACEHGTVRCCRPVEPVVQQETPKPVDIVTPITTVKLVKKTAMCKCKSRKECDRHFLQLESAVDRKDEVCPSSMVRCCETGNMGNAKDQVDKSESDTEAHVLGNSNFKPILLPFLKMPPSNNEV